MRRLLVAMLIVVAVLTVSCNGEQTDAVRTMPAPISTTTTQSLSSTTSALGGTTTTTATPPVTVPLPELRITLAESDTGFDHPVLLVADPDGGSDFVVEQSGRIVRADGGDHAVALDIRGLVNFGGEKGLLGLAFHPDFAQNRLGYVNYTNSDGSTVIAQFEVDGGVFDVSTGLSILVVDQPAGNHNGGMIAFGPRGYLWIGMGDGGASDDKFRNGQDPNTLLGSMLRIAVPGTGTGDGAYDIPDTNPFADGEGGAPEVYWTGLRNPWRFAFDFFADGVNADVWIADVGQGALEEVSVMHAENRRANFGWPIMEGSECFRSDDCSKESYIAPVTEYGRDDGCSITGGYVYRGDAIPELAGHFFYSDFCTGFVRSYSPATGDHDWTSMTGTISSPSSFGIGGDGELYLVSHGGTIYRLERAE